MNHRSVICLNIIVLLLSISRDDLYYFYIYSYHPHPSSSNYLIGFRNVFNLLSSSKKPIVGHNCFFDLLFMIRWLDTTLPPTFEAFRCRLHTLFPSVYDTKFLAASGVVGESLEYSSLEQCYDYYNYHDNHQHSYHNHHHKYYNIIIFRYLYHLPALWN